MGALVVAAADGRGLLDARRRLLDLPAQHRDHPRHRPVLLIPLGFLLAVLLSGRVRGSGALRALAFAPAIIAPILVGLIWIFILDLVSSTSGSRSASS
ncbi:MULTISPECIES: hypothetical protein [unclassified Streptomyces]|uniref:hypothetical protein n=1 Tax=unclassified Streptomyces TaxID=2593676 RepID=UPI001F2F8D19|nr:MULTISPECIES: hypothetical protein [unclassified Streptomyces]